jgi:hypothetical protein
MKVLILLAAVLVGCNSPVLEGPNFPAEEPPWIAAGYSEPVPPMLVRERVILIGDAGLYLDRDPTLAALGQWAGEVAGSTVLFLGDNIYDNGLTEEERVEAERIISQQLAATAELKVFIPGNHDWGMDPAQQNVAAILNQQGFIDAWPEGNTRFLPRDGCLGPGTLVLSPSAQAAPAVVLVLLDPTPFLTPRLNEVCPQLQGEDAHFRALATVLAEHADDHVIVASHYPMLTGGPHGGLSYGAIGDAIVGVYALMYGGLGNTYEPAYAGWIEKTAAVLRKNPPLIYAAGHDHNLQVLQAGDVAGLHVVSGAGAPARVSTVTNLPDSIFAHAAPGFVVLDFGQRDGLETVILRVVENGFDRPVFEMLVPPQSPVTAPTVSPDYSP